ncbi:HTH DNA binding protein [Arthrobacter phage Timinator]|uniref:HTH DNA binding protein n=3 Tax=Marthavirus barretlemon TaxID=2560300 RepID=A0A386KM49_9CAUD|nr:HTH DNA binding protein [Arthrobacter phage Timinator]AYD86472.1 HTH DNA binding protein [Arthrobacter phage LeeroyJ]QJD53331.1 helix-turn-helix DNA-binding domain protein [Arthrobacter phage StevieBAY]
MRRKMTPKTLDLAKRDARALELFQMGLTYQQIADAKWKDGTLFNGDRGNCYKVIRKHIQEVVREPAEEARTEELLRLNTYLKALGPRVLRGDVQAINTALKVGDSRAKLLGLYEPMKVEASGPMQVVFSAALQTDATMAEPEMDVERQK